MYFGKASDAKQIKLLNLGLAFKVIPVPQLPKTAQNEQDVNWASYWALGVSSKTEKKDAAWDLVKYLSSREVMNVMAQNRFAPARQDLASLFSEDPVFGAYIRQAPTARSWYLASDTNDGAKGINSQISDQYKAAVLRLVDQDSVEDVLAELSSRVSAILSSFKK